MRLRIALWSLAILFTLNFVACGGGSLTTNQPPTTTPSLTSISVTPGSAVISAGATQQFKATGSYSDGSSKDLTTSVRWAVSTSSVATISNSGLLTPVAAGQVTVSAALKTVQGSTAATITDNLVSIEVSGSEVNLNIGSTVQLAAMGSYQDKKPAKILRNVTWTSSAPSVATVSSTGLVTGVNAGSATIQATLSGIKGSLGLGVNAAILESITIGPSSPSVNVASQQQLSATGHYNDGSTKNITASVTWKSSDATKATITNAGLVTGVYHGQITITATFNSVAGSAPLNVIAVLNSISITPIGPAVLVGGNQQFKATGLFNDGSSSNLTSSVSWSSSSQSIATIGTGGKATGMSVGAVNLTASQSGVNAVTALNVVGSTYANLNSNYAFALNAVDSRGPAMWAGSLDFNGGAVTGLEDCNTASGVQQQIAIAGTYILYPDGRGNLTFNNNACHASGVTFRFALTSGGTAGSLIEFDGVNTTHGSLIQQNAAAFNTAAINGIYVFRVAGLDGRNSPPSPQGITAIGLLNTDGNGNITAGVDDINDYGTVEGQNLLSASTYSINSNGRGTMQLIDGNGTTNYAVYVVDSTQMYFIETDAAPNTAVLGIAELQTPGSYGNVTGTFSYLIDSPVVVEPNVPQIVVKEGQLGEFSLTAPNVYSGVMNDDIVNGTYLNNYGTINGHGQVSTCNSGQTCSNQFDQKTYFYYMVSPSKMLIMQAFAYSNYPQYSPAVGEADLQVQTPYGVTTLTGNYVLQAHAGSSFADALMLMNFDGTGNIAGIVDQDQIGAVSSTLLVSPQYNLAPSQSGNAVIQMTTPGGPETYYFYVYSNSNAFLGGLINPLDGTLTQQ